MKRAFKSNVTTHGMLACKCVRQHPQTISMSVRTVLLQRRHTHAHRTETEARQTKSSQRIHEKHNCNRYIYIHK